MAWQHNDGHKEMPMAHDEPNEPTASLKVPNAETRSAMAEADEIVAARRARFKDADSLINDLEKASDK